MAIWNGMKHLLEDWTAYLLAVEGRAYHTATKYRAVVDDLVRRQAIAAPSELTFPVLERHLRELFAAGYADATRARAVGAIRSLCRYLGARGVLGPGENPGLNLRPPRVYRRERPTLRPQEIERLIYAGGRRGELPWDPMELRDRVIWAVMYIAGLRVSEPTSLRVDHLQWHEEQRAFSILVRGAKAAGGDVRISLDRDTSRLLASYLPARAGIIHAARRAAPIEAGALFPSSRAAPLSGRQVNRLFHRHLERAGIKGESRRLTPHVFRHSLATHLLRAGWDAREVQLRMRHQHLETTMVYLHADLAKEAARLERLHPLRAQRRQRAINVPAALHALLDDLRETVM
jgi:site-specific recombinase XerD